MKIHIQFLRQPSLSRQALRDRGWRLNDEQNETGAEHPHIEDEEAAREALWRLGLLTSGNVRIRFDRPVRDSL